MKVTMDKDSRKVITLEEAPIVKRIINEMKEDESTAAEYITYAINAANKGSIIKVYEATATIAKNRRASNCYGENTWDIDIWIHGTAQTYNGFIIIGAYLSDIWSLTSENHEFIAQNHFYVRWFAEAK